MEFLQELEQNGHARNDDLGAARPDAGDLAAAGEIALRQLEVELTHLRGGDAQAVDLVALGARHAGEGAGDGGSGGGGGDGAVPARVAEAAHGGVELGLNVLAHLVQLDRGGRVVPQKNLAQPDGPQRFGERFPQAAGFGGDDLGAAAADIDDEDAFGRLRPVALDAEVNQARFFAAGDDLDRGANGFRRARQKSLLVAAVADGAGGHRADAHHVQLAVDRGHAGQHGARGLQGIFADRAGAENALTQARNFAFRGQDAGRLPRHDFGGLHADGVAADVDGGVTGHASMLEH